ncbi:FAR1-related sequence 10, partial [Tanacetum coccineum]
SRQFTDKKSIKSMVSSVSVANRRQLYIWNVRGKWVKEKGLTVNGPSLSKLKNVGGKWVKEKGATVNGPSPSKLKNVRGKRVNEKGASGSSNVVIKENYALELQRTNPVTTVKIDIERCCDPSAPKRQFKRIYVGIGALKKGFKAGLKDLLGLDGCFMKGPFPGQLLSAVGIDPNHDTYHLAYALVKAETISSWTWFMTCLGDDLELGRNSNFTFISDRQKSTDSV